MFPEVFGPLRVAAFFLKRATWEVIKVPKGGLVTLVTSYLPHFWKNSDVGVDPKNWQRSASNTGDVGRSGRLLSHPPE
jgi:hypothetical protein